MSAPNRNVLWARAFVDELVAAGVDAACVAPGSRSTPLTVALAEREEVTIHGHLDERSAAYFALGRGKRTGRPTPVVCTSGTAAANLHPAVIEADRARVPLLVATADRPPELGDSGANQTIDQQKLYGDAVRWYRDLAEPAADARKLRSLRTTVGRAVAATTADPAGPVHLNVRFRKPLEPTAVPGDVPDGFAERHPRAARGRGSEPYVRVHGGRASVDDRTAAAVARAVADAARGLLVCGPAGTGGRVPARNALAALADATGFPVLADPLSGHRFGPHVAGRPVVGAYDAVLDERVVADWPDPDLVVRFGASPTSKRLREYLADVDARQFLVDPAGGWREATFAATDLVAADPTPFAGDLAARLDDADGGRAAWRERFVRADERARELHADESTPTPAEGRVLAEVIAGAPDPATVVVSNSMPVRDLDRFGAPREAALTVLANRGASGIDGVTSTALGAGSATDDPLVLAIGDLAYYHDANGLLALSRCGVDATIVLVNNDGGGIFHLLPIESFDPPFTEQFRTPHGLDFAPTADLYGFEFVRATPEAFPEAYRASLASDGTQVIEVRTDAERNHRDRERLDERVVDAL